MENCLSFFTLDDLVKNGNSLPLAGGDEGEGENNGLDFLGLYTHQGGGNIFYFLRGRHSSLQQILCAPNVQLFNILLGK